MVLTTKNATWRVACVVIGLLWLVACTPAPQQLSLQVLADNQQQVSGQHVITEGVVRGFDDPEHYWLEDSAMNRVAVHPQYLLADKVGERVQVRGQFHADRERGRWIDARELTVLESD